MRDNLKRISKNVIILFLLLSLLILTMLTWFSDMQPGNTERRRVISELFGGLFWNGDDVDSVYPGYEEYDYTMSILSPVRAAVRSDVGLTYLTNRDDARELFERASAVLADAMDSANTRQELEDYQWRNILSGDMILFDFEGEMPLDMLAAVIGSADYDAIETQARYIVLFIHGETLSLAVMPKGGTPVSYTTTLQTAELASLIREFGLCKRAVCIRG